MVRRDPAIRSRGDAQGFRTVDGKKLRVRSSGGQYFHYGHALKPELGQRKLRNLSGLYNDDAGVERAVSSRPPTFYYDDQKSVELFATYGQDIQLLYDSMRCLGASGALFGLLGAFGLLFPNTELYMMFIPIPIKAKYFVIFYAAIELFSGIGQFEGDNVAHFAHLGGLAVGLILVLIWRKNRTNFY